MDIKSKGHQMTKRTYQMTGLEQEAADALDEMGIKYTPQYSTRTGFVIDFMIHLPSGDVPLETDGPTHKGKRRSKDAFRTKLLRREGRRKPIRVSYKELKDRTMKEILEERIAA